MEIKKKQKRSSVFIILIQIILGLVLIFSLYKIGMWIFENYKTQEVVNEIEKQVEEVLVKDLDTGEEKYKINVNFEELKNINNDVKGYLKVNNTNVEYPVVKSSNNDFYLTRSFDKSYNSAGWIFADYKNEVSHLDKNLVIYGHNREDLSMFGSLKIALTDEWNSNKENQIITLVTENNYYEYEIFSVYTVMNEEYYITTEFKNNEFSNFINTIKNRSIKDFNIEVLETDSILTLSTCYANGVERMVIHAKLIGGI